MPMRGSLASTDLTIDATLMGAACAFAWRESRGTGVVFAVCGFDGIHRIESNWQGKFWYSAVPSLATHLNISAEAKGAAQNAGSINAMSARLPRNGWRTWFPPSKNPLSLRGEYKLETIQIFPLISDPQPVHVFFPATVSD